MGFDCCRDFNDYEPTSMIKNAIIDSITLDYGDRGVLTAWLYLDYGGSQQGFGGFALHLPKDFKHHKHSWIAGHFITRCIQIAGVGKWEELPGKTIRVKTDSENWNSSIESIGHIIKDDWFNPKQDFKELVKG